MKKILLTMTGFALLGTAFAQDFDDYGYEEDTPSVVINGEAGVKGRAWFNTEADYKKKTNIFNQTENQASAYGKVEFNYSASASDVNVKFRVDSATVNETPEDILEEAVARGYFGNWVVSAGKMKVVWGKGDKLHVLDNFNANNYTDFIFPDYVDRRLAEPMLSIAYSVPNASNIRIEGIVTPMMTADRMATSGTLVPAAQRTLTSTVEGIIKNNLVQDVNGLASGSASTVVDSIMSASSFTSDALFTDNTKSLKYAQAGARVTGTLGSIDWGLSYYAGHYKQPSANLSPYINSIETAVGKYVKDGLTDFVTYAKTSGAQGSLEFYNAHGAEILKIAAEKYGLVPPASPAALLTDPTALPKVQAAAADYAAANGQKWVYDGTVNTKLATPELNYDQLQTFGFELATVLWKFNTRAEFAYNLTKDTTGDDPWVKNNSLGWIVGFDMDLPIHNLNINVQNQGSYILKNDKITNEHDVDFNTDDKYINNKFVVNISDKWLHEKLTTECTTIYTLENKEWCVQPKIEYNPVDGLFFTLSGAYLFSNNENGEFYNFTADSVKHHRKAFAQCAVKYCF